MAALLTEVGTALGDLVTWVGSVVTALTSSTGALNGLLPVFALGIAVSVLMLAIGCIRKFTWAA